MQERAAVGNGRGGFEVAPIEVGAPGPGEVRVRLRASGLCHTDWDSLRWGRPVVLGHEGAGVVEAVGAGVEKVAPGDRVVLNWAIPCGHCPACANGDRNLCEAFNPVVGPRRGGHAFEGATLRDGRPLERSFHLGTLSTATVVRVEACVPLPPEVPWSSACIVGCGVMTGFGSVVNVARVPAGSTAVVLGAGGVGLNVVQGCRIAGAARIVAVDVRQARLEAARRFGATDVLRADAGDQGLRGAAAQVRDMLGGRGADYAFECTAVPALGAAPLAFVRNGGTAVQVSGIEQEIPFDMELFEWDKVYINPLYGKCRPEVDFPRIFALYQRGELLLDELVTRVYGLDEVRQAFDDLLACRSAKVVVVIGD